MKKQPVLFEGIGLALFFSIVAAAGFFVLTSLFPASSIFRLLVAALSFVYLTYLLIRSSERIGRITVIAFWFSVAILNWLFTPYLLLYVVIHLGMIWLIRSLYYYNSVLSSITDLGLTGISLVTAIWAWANTHSIFLAFWCFFLVQALFILVPKNFKKTAHQVETSIEADDQFERAHHAAEFAVRKLTSTN